MVAIESAGIAGLVERCHERLEHGIRRSSIETFNPVKTVNDLLRPEHQ